jgi:hypothetical protein
MLTFCGPVKGMQLLMKSVEADYIIKTLNASDTVIFIFSQGQAKKSLDP